MGQIIQTLQYLLFNYCRQTDDDEVVDGCNGIDSGGKGLDNKDILHFVYRWMGALAKCGRFDLNIEFLNAEQKNCPDFIFHALEQGKIIESREADGATKLKSLYGMRANAI